MKNIYELSIEEIASDVFDDAEKCAHTIISALDKNKSRKYLIKMDDCASEFLMYSTILHVIYAFEMCMRHENIDESNSNKFNEIIRALILKNCIKYVGNNYSFVEQDYLRIQSNIVNAINNMGGQGITLNITYSLVNNICDRNKIKYSIFGKSNFVSFMDDVQRALIKFMQEYIDE